MRVLQLGPFPPPHGGVQTHLVALRDALRARQIPCAVINLTRKHKQPADDVYYPENARELLVLLFSLRYDIAHLHLGGNLTTRLLRLCLACGSIPGNKVVLTFHSGGYPSSPEAQRPSRFRNFVLQRFDRLIAVNPEIAGFFERCGVPRSRIRLIPPYTSVSEGAELTPELASFYAAHNPVLLTVGLLEPEYDLSRQIEALSAVRREFPGAGLAIVGSGSLESRLREEIRRAPWAEHILLAGDVPHPATLRAIANASVLLRTTLYDGDSISVREALDLGTPVIATDNGMRPAGVTLIPSADLSGTIVDCLNQGKRPPSSASDDNLSQVLALYEELIGR